MHNTFCRFSTSWLEHLQAHPPWPNYRHRRILADDLHLLDLALVTADPDQRQSTLAVQRRYWELFTGGDALFAPHPLTIPADQHAHWRQQRHELDDKQAELFAAAFQILDRSSPLLLGKLLSWQPP